jgi:hypothetical protein
MISRGHLLSFTPAPRRRLRAGGFWASYLAIMVRLTSAAATSKASWNSLGSLCHSFRLTRKESWAEGSQKEG